MKSGPNIRPMKIATKKPPMTTAAEIESAQKTLLDNGTVLITKLSEQISLHLDRAVAAVTSIHELLGNEGISDPALDKSIRDVNELQVFKERINKFMVEVKDDSRPLDERVALISSMVELADTVGHIENTTEQTDGRTEKN